MSVADGGRGTKRIRPALATEFVGSVPTTKGGRIPRDGNGVIGRRGPPVERIGRLPESPSVGPALTAPTHRPRGPGRGRRATPLRLSGHCIRHCTRRRRIVESPYFLGA